ncbi:hypothetical protein EJB05_37113, partial [Eragrostis curvula]
SGTTLFNSEKTAGFNSLKIRKGRRACCQNSSSTSPPATGTRRALLHRTLGCRQYTKGALLPFGRLFPNPSFIPYFHRHSRHHCRPLQAPSRSPSSSCLRPSCGAYSWTTTASSQPWPRFFPIRRESLESTSSTPSPATVSPRAPSFDSPISITKALCHSLSPPVHRRHQAAPSRAPSSSPPPLRRAARRALSRSGEAPQPFSP